MILLPWARRRAQLAANVYRNAARFSIGRADVFQAAAKRANPGKLLKLARRPYH
jgi:hypothetical protein